MKNKNTGVCYQLGDPVMLNLYSGGSVKRVKGRIARSFRDGRHVSYEVRTAKAAFRAVPETALKRASS